VITTHRKKPWSKACRRLHRAVHRPHRQTARCAQRTPRTCSLFSLVEKTQKKLSVKRICSFFATSVSLYLKVHSITANNKYLIIYTDGDSEEMSHREFLKHNNKNVVGQVAELNKSNQDKNIQWVKLSCNCVAASCIHPWGNASLRSRVPGSTGKIRVQDNKSMT
jgi:hypothetical protein